MHDERKLTLAKLREHPVPYRVLVGCAEYVIVLVSPAVADANNEKGATDGVAQRIWLREDLRADHAAQILIHEIMHACYEHYGIVERRPEEYTVNALSGCLAAVFAANPQVLAWIAWALGANDQTSAIDPQETR